MASEETGQKQSPRPKNSELLSDVAYTRILEKLFDRGLPAGSFVSQSHLVDLLQVPVAPLRDALRVLEAEGILRIHPRAGIEFVKPGLELTKSTYQFRTILERAAVRIFAETGDDRVIDALSTSHAKLLESIKDSGLTAPALDDLERLEYELHTAIIGILDNPLVENSYKRMHNYLRLVRLDRRLTAPLAIRSLEEHVQIIDACKARDADAAEIALNAHFTAALQRHMGLF